MNVTKLAAWLRKIPSGVIRISATFTGMVEEPVWTWELHAPKGTKSKDKTQTRLSEQDLASDILEVLRNDTDNRQANCRYRLEALDEDGEVKATFTAKERWEGNHADPVDVDGEASLSGVVTQVLRHNEALLRLYVSSMREIQGGYHELLRIQSHQISDMRAREKALQEMMMEYSQHVDSDTVTRSESMTKLTDALVTEVMPRAGAIFDMYASKQGAQQP